MNWTSYWSLKSQNINHVDKILKNFSVMN